MTLWLSTDYGATLAALAPWMPDAVDVPLSPEDLDRLIDRARGDAVPGSPGAFSRDLRDQFAEAIDAVGPEAFVRNSFCSFRPMGGALSAVHGPEGALSLMERRNARVAALLGAARTAHAPVSLYITEWRDMAPDAEFRAFVYQGEVAGISQYHHRRIYHRLLTDAVPIEAALRDALSDIVRHLPRSTLVVDLEWRPSDDERPVMVIETNPFTTQTDACLFSWANGGDFDRSFRVRSPDSGIAGSTRLLR